MSDIQIEEIPFGKLDDNEIKLFRIKNKTGFEVNVISYGASVQSIITKDKDNKATNVVLGFETIEEYANQALNPYFGCAVGRVANRISNGEFKLNDVTYKLEKNNGKHCLHSGSSGISMKNWSFDLIDDGVKFSYLSPNGEGGFPGEVLIEAIYKIDSTEHKLTIQYNALTDLESTPINLTNHTYFNLVGNESKTKIYDHYLKLNSKEYLDFNPDEVTVTGKVNSVENTKYDFTNLVKLGDRIKHEGQWPDEGYDNFFVLNGQGNDLTPVATVKNKSNGIVLDVSSNQKGVQFYTGNFLNVKKSNGYTYLTHEGFCLETHNYPDSVNHNNFPSCILSPEEEYSNTTTLSFSVEN